MIKLYLIDKIRKKGAVDCNRLTALLHVIKLILEKSFDTVTKLVCIYHAK
ncbi:hypothetical protein KWV16_18655 [Clostridioides difficile]|nr:hypothetical protein [Clostridioides difficile]